MYDEDSDYDGLIGKWVEELSEVFANQGHSETSAEMTLMLFNKLMDEYKHPSEEELNKFAKERGADPAFPCAESYHNALVKKGDTFCGVCGKSLKLSSGK